MTASDLRIEPLDRTHIRDRFECGVPSLDTFIRALVSQYDRRTLGRTYVAVRGTDPRVVGYYTISSGAVAFETLPAEGSKRLPRHPVPVVLGARLAVDRSTQGRRLGERLLTDALARSVELSAKLGIHAVVVDAIDQKAAAFYENYQFTALLGGELHLYLPIPPSPPHSESLEG